MSNALSESIDCGLGHVRYKLHCQVHVKRKFLNLTLQTQRAIMLIRLPSFESQQQCITQTHLINNTGGQLTLMVEKSNITPGILLPIYFSINYSCLVHTVDHLSVKLIERQKYKAPEKQTSRILHNEISLSPTTPFVFGHDENNHNYSEIRTVYVIPDKHTLKVHPSTTYSNIRVRHWLQIYLRLLLKDGTFKDLHIDAPVYVFLASSSDCSILPVYESAPSTSAVASPNYHQRAINEHENLGNRIICRSISSSNFLCSLTKPTSWLKKASHTVKNGKKKNNALMMLMTDPPPCYEEALVGTSN